MRECELSTSFFFGHSRWNFYSVKNAIRPAMNLILFNTLHSVQCNICSVSFLNSSFLFFFFFFFFCSFQVWRVGDNAILTFRANRPFFKLYIRLLVLAHLSSQPRRTEGAIIFLFCWRSAISFPLEGQRDSIIIVRFIPSELSGLLSPF